MRETVTYLEMTDPRELTPARPAPAMTLTRAAPGSPLIRTMIVRVGEPHGWRSGSWPDERWAAVLANPRAQGWFVTHEARHIGIAAYELHPGPEVQITQFGLVPEFVGRGLGGHALTLAIRTAWQLADDVRRIWLHTSSLDHPNALANYRARGLRPYRTEEGDR